MKLVVATRKMSLIIIPMQWKSGNRRVGTLAIDDDLAILSPSNRFVLIPIKMDKFLCHFCPVLTTQNMSLVIVSVAATQESGNGADWGGWGAIADAFFDEAVPDLPREDTRVLALVVFDALFDFGGCNTGLGASNDSGTDWSCFLEREKRGGMLVILRTFYIRLYFHIF